ncbi:hypothetical protein V9K67_24585 [Paraflavisolibacter sp. H34]|uniref:hypothetical protein n=1 Tax=Huijunlia imazamoxiresistens TaxID=3127457 RepID=UPI003016A7D9
MKKNLVPLSLIRDGKYFRLPGKTRKYQKLNNEQTLAAEPAPEGDTLVQARPACLCVSSSGRSFVKSWWDWVEEA